MCTSDISEILRVDNTMTVDDLATQGARASAATVLASFGMWKAKQIDMIPRCDIAYVYIYNFDGFMQNGGISIANTLEIPQSCTTPSIFQVGYIEGMIH